MKNKIIIGAIGVLCIGGFGYYIFSKENMQKETKKGQNVYNIDDYITYSNKQSVEVNTYEYCNEDESLCEFSEEKGERHTYSIIDGKIRYTTSNGQNYTFKKINNAISIQAHTDGMAVTNTYIEVLTSTGEVYTMYDYSYLMRMKNEEDVIKYSNVENFKIDKMGITSSAITSKPQVVLKTIDGRYLRLEEETKTMVESNAFSSKYDVLVD